MSPLNSVTRIRVPRVYREFTTSRVLTMDFLNGSSVDDAEELEKRGIDPKELAAHITEIIYEQIFEHGFFHGDPHPGNMLIMKGGITSGVVYPAAGVELARRFTLKSIGGASAGAIAAALFAAAEYRRSVGGSADGFHALEALPARFGGTTASGTSPRGRSRGTVRRGSGSGIARSRAAV